MKTMRIIRLIFTTTLSMVLFCGIAMAEKKYNEEIAIAIEKSSLSQEQKSSLLNRSYAAINSGIPPDDISIIIRRGLSDGWDSKSLEGLMSIVISAKEQNLPLRSVLNRIEQGLSKRVSSEKILYATKMLIEKTAAADGIVNNLVRSGMKTNKDTEKDETVQTVARALEKSVPEETIMQIGQKIVKQNHLLSRFNAATSTMTTFIEIGMPLEHASKIIHKAIDKGYKEEDMIMMERVFFNGIKSGLDINHIMQKMDSMMNRGGTGFPGMSGGSGMHGGSGMGGSGVGGGMSGGGSGGRHGGR